MFSVKKSYYRLALIHHPDRVDENRKQESSDKFNIIHQAYHILADHELKKIYDENGSHAIFAKPTISCQWERYLKTITDDDIYSARDKYQGSVDEESDVIKQIVIGRGSLTHLLNSIPFMRYEDESRILNLIKKLISEGKLPKINIKKIQKQ